MSLLNASKNSEINLLMSTLLQQLHDILNTNDYNRFGVALLDAVNIALNNNYFANKFNAISLKLFNAKTLWKIAGGTTRTNNKTLIKLRQNGSRIYLKRNLLNTRKRNARSIKKQIAGEITSEKIKSALISGIDVIKKVMLTKRKTIDDCLQNKSTCNKQVLHKVLEILKKNAPAIPRAAVKTVGATVILLSHKAIESIAISFGIAATSGFGVVTAGVGVVVPVACGIILHQLIVYKSTQSRQELDGLSKVVCGITIDTSTDNSIFNAANRDNLKSFKNWWQSKKPEDLNSIITQNSADKDSPSSESEDNQDFYILIQEETQDTEKEATQDPLLKVSIVMNNYTTNESKNPSKRGFEFMSMNNIKDEANKKYCVTNMINKIFNK